MSDTSVCGVWSAECGVGGELMWDAMFLGEAKGSCYGCERGRRWCGCRGH